MRCTLKPWILAALMITIGAGCSGYDRELLGEPEPARRAEAEVVNEPAPEEIAEATDEFDVGMFDDLKFYGTWHWIDPYGWVWRPIVVSEWQPFLYGHWIWSQYGWMWVSYDPWGWATAHYGFWTLDFVYGWIWIPDYEWSPCRCDWILYDDYICWSPVPPPGVKFKEPWEPDQNPWVSVPVGRFKETSVGNYRTTPKFKSGYSDRTLRRSPPEAHDIERISGKTMSVVDVQLDREVFGEREFARVRLPADQQQIVDKQRSKMKTPNSDTIRSGGTRSKYQPGPQTQSEVDTGSDDPRTHGKSTSSSTRTETKKDSGGSKKDTDKKEPQEYKEKRKDDEKKDDKAREPKSKEKK